VVWELNRHQWLVRLGAAYRLTGDERYARVFAADVRAWLAANPRASGSTGRAAWRSRCG